MHESSKTICYPFPNSAYKQGLYVGKSLAQVGKSLNGIVSGDSEVYQKWSQALSSIEDLIFEANSEGERDDSSYINLFFPILVVPDGTLWQVNYNNNGQKSSDPKQVERISYYVGQEYNINTYPRVYYTISHLEFITLSGLESFFLNITPNNHDWFPTTDFIKDSFDE